MVRELGEWLAESHPEIADQYRAIEQPFRAVDIGIRLLPDAAQISQDVVAKAVIRALRLMIPPKEREALTQARRAQCMKKRWDFTSSTWSEHCRAAAQKRHSEGAPGVNVTAMLQGRNRTAWIKEEKQVLVHLFSDRGVWTYKEIAHVLNERFHGKRNVRSEGSCRAMIADLRCKKRNITS